MARLHRHKALGGHGISAKPACVECSRHQSVSEDMHWPLCVCPLSQHLSGLSDRFSGFLHICNLLSAVGQSHLALGVCLLVWQDIVRFMRLAMRYLAIA